MFSCASSPRRSRPSSTGSAPPRGTIQRARSGGLRRSHSSAKQLCDADDQHENMYTDKSPRPGGGDGREALSPLAVNSPDTMPLSESVEGVDDFALDAASEKPAETTPPPLEAAVASLKKVLPFCVSATTQAQIKCRCGEVGMTHHTASFTFFLLAISRTLGSAGLSAVQFHVLRRVANRAVGFDGRMGEAESLREVMDRFAVQLLPLLHHDRQAATPAADVVFAVLDQGVDTQAAFGDAAFALGVTDGEGGELNGFLRYDPGRLDPGAAAEAVTNFLHLHEASCEVGDWSMPLRVLQAQALARATGVATAQAMVAAGGATAGGGSPDPPPVVPQPESETETLADTAGGQGRASPSGEVPLSPKLCCACKAVLDCDSAAMGGQGEVLTGRFFAFDRVFCSEFCQQRFVQIAAQGRKQRAGAH